LFDILGFFNNVNPERAIAILQNLGFPPNVCKWTLSFLTGREAAIHLENYISPPFPILNGTPQGSPLSLILSALYMSPLLKMAKSWSHSNLSLYVDNRAIYSVSAITSAATEKAHSLYKKVLRWLGVNGLSADPDKSELMVFVKQQYNTDLTGAHIHSTWYLTNTMLNCISIVHSLQYLGVYISDKLNWSHHVSIMATCARSTICSIGLLSNSIYSLNLLNWHKVYNALIIPTLT
jgi:hypothetical protein